MKWIFTRYELWTYKIVQRLTFVAWLWVFCKFRTTEIWVSFKSGVKKTRIWNQSETRNTNIVTEMNWNGHIWMGSLFSKSDKFGVITPLIPSVQSECLIIASIGHQTMYDYFELRAMVFGANVLWGGVWVCAVSFLRFCVILCVCDVSAFCACVSAHLCAIFSSFFVVTFVQLCC